MRRCSPPGEFLSEQALADVVGLGRTPIREALQRLAREGLVTILPRRGVLVAPVDAGEQLLVVEVRRELERLIARNAAERSTDSQRASFAAIADGMDRAGRANDALEFLRLDRELNLLMLDAAHNAFAARAMQPLAGLSRRYWYQNHRAAADLPLCARLHAPQARAVAAGYSQAPLSDGRVMAMLRRSRKRPSLRRRLSGGPHPFEQFGAGDCVIDRNDLHERRIDFVVRHGVDGAES